MRGLELLPTRVPKTDDDDDDELASFIVKELHLSWPMLVTMKFGRKNAIDIDQRLCNYFHI